MVRILLLAAVLIAAFLARFPNRAAFYPILLGEELVLPSLGPEP